MKNQTDDTQVRKGDRIASKKVQKAAKRVVRYLEHDEYLDYIGDTDAEDHIWHSVRVLRDWLDMPVDEHEGQEICDAKSERLNMPADKSGAEAIREAIVSAAPTVT